MDAFTDEFDAATEDAPLPSTLDMDIDVTFQKKRFPRCTWKNPRRGNWSAPSLN